MVPVRFFGFWLQFLAIKSSILLFCSASVQPPPVIPLSVVRYLFLRKQGRYIEQQSLKARAAHDVGFSFCFGIFHRNGQGVIMIHVCITVSPSTINESRFISALYWVFKCSVARYKHLAFCQAPFLHHHAIEQGLDCLTWQ